MVPPVPTEPPAAGAPVKLEVPPVPGWPPEPLPPQLSRALLVVKTLEGERSQCHLNLGQMEPSYTVGYPWTGDNWHTVIESYLH